MLLNGGGILLLTAGVWFYSWTIQLYTWPGGDFLSLTAGLFGVLPPHGKAKN